MGNDQDAMWTDDLLKIQPTVPVPAGLQARILADFDAVASRRGVFDRLRDAIWPGVPVWRPAAVLAAALAIGVTLGTYMPLEDGAEQTASISLDAPPSFDLGESS